MEFGASPCLMGVDAAHGPKEAPQFSPYNDNGGSVAAVGGKDYVILAADTRLSLGYAIPTRYVSRVLKITDKVLLGSAGMQADMCQLHKVITARHKIYEHDNNKILSLGATAQMLSTILYSGRFFPYYTFNIVAGLDEDGAGYVYGYDAIGSFEKKNVVCTGAATSMMQPIFDNQVDWAQSWDGEGKTDLSLDDAVKLVKDAFTSACERAIQVGDTLEIYKVTKEGISKEEFALRKD